MKVSKTSCWSAIMSADRDKSVYWTLHICTVWTEHIWRSICADPNPGDKAKSMHLDKSSYCSTMQRCLYVTQI